MNKLLKLQTKVFARIIVCFIFFDCSSVLAQVRDIQKPIYFDAFQKKATENFFKSESHEMYLSQWILLGTTQDKRKFETVNSIESSILRKVAKGKSTSVEGGIDIKSEQRNGFGAEVVMSSERSTEAKENKKDLFAAELSYDIFNILKESGSALEDQKILFQAASSRASLIAKHADLLKEWNESLTSLYAQLCYSQKLKELESRLQSLKSLTKIKLDKGLISRLNYDEFLRTEESVSRKVTKSELAIVKFLNSIAKFGSFVDEYIRNELASNYSAACVAQNLTGKRMMIAEEDRTSTSRFGSLYGLRAQEIQDDLELRLIQPQIRPFFGYEASSDPNPKEKFSIGVRFLWEDVSSSNFRSTEEKLASRKFFLAQYQRAQWRERNDHGNLLNLSTRMTEWTKREILALEKSREAMNLLFEQFRIGIIGSGEISKSILNHYETLEVMIEAWKEQTDFQFELLLNRGVSGLSGQSLFLDSPFSFQFILAGVNKK